MMAGIVRNKDLLFGLAGIVVGGVFFREAGALTYPSKVFPIFVSSLIVFISALIAVRALWSGLSEATRRDPPIMPSATTLLVVAGTVAYILGVGLLGFYVSSLICIVVLSIITANQPTGVVSLVNTMLAAIIFLGGVYFIFSYLLRSSIPSGLFM